MTASPDIRLVHLVVPAHNEEAYLPRHLSSVRSAVTELRVRTGLEARVSVVLDSCNDSSASLLHAYDWVDVVTVESGIVGDVRALGVLRAQQLAGPMDPRAVWIASTDADTVVPRTWLVEQVRLAAAGHELVLGTVSPNSSDLSQELYAAWEARHVLEEGHTHVHGANMGYTLAAYRLVGGYSSLGTGEDVLLANRMQDAGVPWCATARTQVVTSGRRIGRVAHGFSSYLRELTA